MQITTRKKNIADADKFFGSKDYSNAKVKYSEALTVKSNDEYSNTKLKEIDKIIADQNLASAKAKELKNEQDYKEAITNGDKLLKEKTYNQAKEQYKKALAIKQNDSYASSKISEIDKAIDLAKINTK